MASKIDLKSFHRLTLDGLDLDLVVSWSQDGSKTVQEGSGGGLGSSWEGLGPLLGALGASWDGLGGVWGRLEGVLGVVLVSF